MALRSGYKGFKKLLGLKTIRPGTLAVDDAALANTFFPRSEQAVLGATNILPTSIARPTVGEATATLNTDKSVTVNTSGTTAADRYIIGSDYFTVPKGTWYFSGNKSENTAIDIDMMKESDGSVLVSNNATDPTPKEFTLESATSVRLIIKVKSGQTVSNKTVYPMIALSADAPYAPYAMTNKELTDKVNGMVDYVNTTANNGNAYTDSLDDAPLGFVYCSSGCTNNPVNKWGVTETIKASSTAKIQKFYSVETDDFCIRRMVSSVWQAWKKVTTTSVS